MKKLVSTLVAALVAVSFAGLVFAADPAPSATPAMPAGHPPVKQEAPAPAKTEKKAKKAKKAPKKEAAKPAEAPAPAAAPAAK